MEQLDVLHHTENEQVDAIHLDMAHDDNLLKQSSFFFNLKIIFLENLWALSFKDRRRFADLMLANHQSSHLTTIQRLINEYEQARKEFMESSSTRYFSFSFYFLFL
jgi:putative lipoic acid-binding regulatory protein